MSLGRDFIHSMVVNESSSVFIGLGDLSHVFRPSELEVYQYVRDFVKKYGSLPTVDTIVSKFGSFSSSGLEPYSYYLDQLNSRHVEISLKKAISKAGVNLGESQKDPEQALQVLSSAVMDLATQRYGASIVDFREAYDLIIPDYLSKYYAEDGQGLMYGWPTLDNQTLGVRKGDMVSEVGRPAMGKTWRLLYGAHYGWAKVNRSILQYEDNPDPKKALYVPEGGSRLFVSMEMPVLEIEQRLAALHTRVAIKDLDHANLSSVSLKRLRSGLTEIKGYASPFWVVDGNMAATVEDITMLARQLKPDAIFIDGGYLVKHPTERDRYRRVAENADLMKRELASLAPTTVSWQFAKSASKKKKGEAVTGDDVGYSDAIYQASSILMGLFQPDSVETLNQRVTEILKGRKGQAGRFVTNWDFRKMDFSEIAEPHVGELQYI